MAVNQEDRNSDIIQAGNGKSNAVLDFLGCSYRATVRLIKGLPSRFVNYFKRKIKEYRNRPKRTDISRVYVVVCGKKNDDNKKGTSYINLYSYSFYSSGQDHGACELRRDGSDIRYRFLG